MIHLLKLACVPSSLFQLYYGLVLYEMQGFKEEKARFIRKILHPFPYIAESEFNLRTWPLGQPGPSQSAIRMR
jgi:hypothetical protein